MATSVGEGRDPLLRGRVRSVSLHPRRASLPSHRKVPATKQGVFISSRTPDDTKCCSAAWGKRAAPTLASQRESALVQGSTRTGQPRMKRLAPDRVPGNRMNLESGHRRKLQVVACLWDDVKRHKVPQFASHLNIDYIGISRLEGYDLLNLPPESALRKAFEKSRTQV